MKEKEVLQVISKDLVLLSLFEDHQADMGRGWKAQQDNLKRLNGQEIKIHKSRFH